jgi:hypothetical protein
MIVAALIEKKLNYLKIFCLFDNPLFTITMLYLSNAEAIKTVGESTTVRIQTVKRLTILSIALVIMCHR